MAYFIGRIFGVRKHANFLSILQDEFKAQFDFLIELGFAELANDDEFLCEESFKNNQFNSGKIFDIDWLLLHENNHIKPSYKKR